jgi:YVTN family beta-propeller protein
MKINNYLVILVLAGLIFVLIVLNIQASGQSSKSVNSDAGINSVQVGTDPFAIAIDPTTHKVYVANRDSNTVSVINETTDKVIGKPITVGTPTAIAIDPTTHKVYVTNFVSNTTLVINETTDKVIGKPIHVGIGPSAIAIDPTTHKVYVTNSRSNTVSVLDPNNHNKSIHITVEMNPSAIAIDPTTHKVYVANEFSNTVSVIDRTIDKVIGKPIHVGMNPRGIAIDPDIDKVYVTNSRSNTVSIIDGATNTLLVGIRFNISPTIHSGNILCDKNFIPINQHILLKYNTQCKALFNNGFQFNSWTESLGHNSSKLINTSNLDYGAPENIFLSSIGHPPTVSATFLNITEFGDFTANFKELPSLPTGYLTTLSGFVLTTIIGTYLIPFFISWTKTKRNLKKFNKYHKIISSLYDDGKLDEQDIVSLDNLKRSISDAYANGKINKEYYESLKNEISTSYEDVYRKKILLLKPSDKNIEEKLKEIKDIITDAYSKEKLSEYTIRY